jgi:hypothetical protein
VRRAPTQIVEPKKGAGRRARAVDDRAAPLSLDTESSVGGFKIHTKIRTTMK